MAQTDKMLAEKRGRIGIMTFNNPEKLNAVSFEMWEAGWAILEDFRQDDQIRVGLAVRVYFEPDGDIFLPLFEAA